MKKKCYFVLFVALFVALLGIYSNCYAAINLQDFERTGYNGTKRQLADTLCTQQFGVDLLGLVFTGLNQSTFEGYRSDLISDLADSSFVSVYYACDSKHGGTSSDYGPGLQIYFSKNSDFGTAMTHNYTLYTYRGNYNFSKVVKTSENPSLNGQLTGYYTDKYLYYNNEYFMNAVGNSNPIMSDLIFHPNHDNIATIEDKQFYIIARGRSVNEWVLGTFENLSDFDYVQIKLSGYVYNQYAEIVSSIDKRYNQFIANSGLFVTSDNHLYIKNYKVFYNQGYVLSIYWSDNPDYIDAEEKHYNFYFKPYGESNNLSGDTIVSDYFTPSDQVLSDLQAFDDYINGVTDVPPEQVDQFLGNNFFNFSPYNVNGSFFSGDYSGTLFSGDIFGQLGYVDYTNNNFDYTIYNFYRRLINIFMFVSSDNPSISFNYRGTNYVFHANDFIVPDSPLKTFVSGFLIAGLVYLFIFQIHNFFIALCTLDLFTVLKSPQHDHSIFL